MDCCKKKFSPCETKKGCIALLSLLRFGAEDLINDYHICQNLLKQSENDFIITNLCFGVDFEIPSNFFLEKNGFIACFLRNIDYNAIRLFTLSFDYTSNLKDQITFTT